MTQPYFGSDFYLENGDINISNTGDIQAVSEADNVVQAISNALHTEKGSLFYDMEYGVGLSALIGEKNVLVKRALLRNEVINVLYKDPRIKTVDSVIVEQDENNPSTINVTISATLINGEQVVGNNLVFPFIKPAAETNTITSESQVSSNQVTVYTQYDIYDIVGVYLAVDTEKTGINYYSGGSVNKNKIILGSKLPSTYSKVIIDYLTLNTTYTNNRRVTPVVDEIILCKDGRTLKTNYNVYDLTNIYAVTDSQRIINYAINSTFINTNIVLGENVIQGANYLVTYSTLDL